jgi:DNA mismatch repair protein MLH3
MKQRILAVEDRSEQERLWDGLKRSLAALLIASGRAVSLRVKDAATEKQFAILETKSPGTGLLVQKSDGLSQSGRMQLALSVLRQAGLVTPNSAKTWIPASASSRTTIIKGAISLEPVPTKAIQFLSFGIHSLPQSAHNELYDHINKLFGRSRFGVVENEEPTSEEQQIRQQDHIFEDDDVTRKQKLLRKSVDRWPMFVLNISLKDSKTRASNDEIVQSEAGLKSIIDVLDALITEWLESHHFRSHFKAKKRRRVGVSDIENEDVEVTKGTTDSMNRPRSVQISRRLVRTSTASSSGETSVEQTKKYKPSSGLRPYTGIANFNKLSRIKSSHAAMPFHIAGSKPSNSSHHTSTSISDQTSPFLNSEVLLPGRLTSVYPTSSYARTAPSSQCPPAMHSADDTVPDRFEDEAQDFTDPTTKQQYKVNARTGTAIIPDQFRAKDIAEGQTRNLFDRSIRLPSTKPGRSKLSNPETPGFLNTLLENWKSPIFSSTDKSIPQISLDIPRDPTIVSFSGGKQINPTFDQISKTNASKLTKSALKIAKVIAQVDRKFILITMEVEENGEVEKTILVAVDQHAADERCRVEKLLDELCTPSSDAQDQNPDNAGHPPSIKSANLPTPLIFRISKREGESFTLHAAHFERWGILFDITHPQDIEEKSDLTVRALPPVISQRLAQQPNNIISLLRTELYQFVERPSPTTHSTHSPSLSACPSPSVALAPSATPRITGSTWLNRIHHLPQGITDMVNSRACRSAIMFNDELSRQDCEDLVERLGMCVFPFICAHGRPSMVPLVRLGGEDSKEDIDRMFVGFGTGENIKSVENGFGEAFRRWRVQV